MANVTARKAIEVTNVKVRARLIATVKTAQRFADVKTEENAITFLVNVIASQDSLAHCKFVTPSNQLSCLRKFSFLDVKNVARVEKAETNANLHVVVRTVESAMRKLSSVNAHLVGLVTYAPTGANQDATD